MWQWFLSNGLQILAALAIGAAIFLFLMRLCKRLMDKAVPKEWHDQLQGTQRTVTWIIIGVIGLVIGLAVAAFAISRFGVDVTPVLKAAGAWFLEHGVIILVIIFLAYLIYKIASLILPSIVNRFVKVRGKGRKAQEEVAKRSSTLSQFLTGIVAAVVAIFTLFMILSEIGVDIAPLLAGAGVVGIAVGLGAQKLIGDIINGLFVVLEDYYGKGDWVQIAGIAGSVEDVNIRRTVLRDFDGTVHIIPNSEVKIASNYTKTWARVNLNIPVAYGENLDRVIAVLNRVGEELAEDEHFRSMITNPPQVLRVDNFGDSAIDIKILGETKPSKQWNVMGELRKRIKEAFDEEGIEIPWPHTKVYFGNAPVEGVARGPDQVMTEPAPPAGEMPKYKKRKTLPLDRDDFEDDAGE